MRVQVFFAVPELYAINGAPLARQFNLARFSAGANVLDNSHLLLRAVGEMNNNALKLDAAIHAQLILWNQPASLPT
jgi:hypothetical protein